MPKKISEIQKKQILDDFIKKKSLDDIAKKFNFTKLTILKHLKKTLGEEKYLELISINKSSKKNSSEKISRQVESNIKEINDERNQESFSTDQFVEILPIDYEIDSGKQQDFSSVSIEEVNLPKVVYIIVNNQIELETKLLKEYFEWNFLSEKDLLRNTIEIFYDLKSAKRSIKKEQRVIKVPNSDVFKITAPILKSRGISRIVSSEFLIAI